MSDVMVRKTFEYSLKTTRRIGTALDFVAGGNFNIFSIQNSCILIRKMWGHVTVVGAGVATPFFNFTPVGGVGPSAFCALAVAAAWAADSLVTWSGVQAAALTLVGQVGHSVPSGGANETWLGSDIICCPGIVSITNAAGADATLVIDFYIQWYPGAPNAAVVAL
jgi:hypothetical protein